MPLFILFTNGLNNNINEIAFSTDSDETTCFNAAGLLYTAVEKFNTLSTKEKQTKSPSFSTIFPGGSGGIGRAIATDLAQRGCRVTLACRSPLKAAHVANEIKKATNNQNVFIMKLDLSDMNSVRYFVREFNSLEDRLDILVNNAGW